MEETDKLNGEPGYAPTEGEAVSVIVPTAQKKKKRTKPKKDGGLSSAAPMGAETPDQSIIPIMGEDLMGEDSEPCEEDEADPSRAVTTYDERRRALALAPLTRDERASWEILVADGAWIRRGHRDELMPGAKVLRSAYRLFLKDDTTGRGGIRRKHDKASESAMPDWAIKPNVKRWFLCRRNGLSIEEAYEETGVTYQEILDSCILSETVRCAREGMHASVRQRLVDMSYGVMESAILGADVSKIQYDAASKVLEKQEAAHFGKPDQSLQTELANAVSQGGGITINIVDTAKKYVPPIVANLGDGNSDEVVEV